MGNCRGTVSSVDVGSGIGVVLSLLSAEALSIFLYRKTGIKRAGSLLEPGELFLPRRVPQRRRAPHSLYSRERSERLYSAFMS